MFLWNIAYPLCVQSSFYVMTGIELLHRFDARQYYEPIERLVEKDQIEYFHDYQFGLRHDIGGLPKNITFLLRTMRGQSNPIILGAEPFDIRVKLFNHISNRNKLIYHTSWPFWSGERVPRKLWFDGQRKAWRSFLQDVTTVTVTKASKDAVEEFGGRAIHIPHGVDVSVFHPTEEPTRNKHHVLFVGRLVEEKGIKDLIAATERLNTPDVTLQFVGRGPLAEYLEQYEGPARIEHLGYISDSRRLAHLYAEADVHVLPSYQRGAWEELFGIVIIEAMACGTPTIATNCVGPTEIITDGTTGLLIQQRNVDQLASSIDSILEDNKTRKEMGQQAREVAEQRYDIDKVADQWADVLDL